MAQKEKLIAKIRAAKYLDAKMKQNLLARAENFSEKKAAAALANLEKLAPVKIKMDAEKDKIAGNVLRVLTGLNEYSRRRVRKEKLVAAENSADESDRAARNSVLDKIENA